MTLLLALIVALLGAASLSVVNGACPTGWPQFGENCYFFSPTQWTFDIASSVCQNAQAELASVHSLEENNCLHSVWQSEFEAARRSVTVRFQWCGSGTCLEHLATYRLVVFITEFLKPAVESSREAHWIGLYREEDSEKNTWNWTDGSNPNLDITQRSLWDENCPSNCRGHCVQMKPDKGLWRNTECDGHSRFICKRRFDVIDVCSIEDGWQAYAGQCYKYNTVRRTWQDAVVQCATHDKATLAMLQTADKFEILEHVVSCKDYKAAVWIGLSDTNDTVDIKWLDGASITDANWAPSQPHKPSDPGNNCVGAIPLSSYKWSVDNCQSENEYVCERPQGTCADGWTDLQTGFCYLQILRTRLTWSDAELYCQGFGSGGHLIRIANVREQTALQSLLKDMSVDRVFIGLSDNVVDNTYRWSDSSSLTYQYFEYWERVPKRVDCGFIDYGPKNINASWSTGYCFQQQAFICQVPIHTSPKTQQTPGDWLCPEGTEADQQTGRCYWFSSEAVTYSQARGKCSENGMKLLTIRDMNDQSFVANRLTGSTWIGLEYRGNDLYSWYDNTPLSFQNWEQGGNAGDNDHACVIMRSSPNAGAWLFQACQPQRYYICMNDAVHVTATTPSPAPTGAWSPQCGSGWRYNPMDEACYNLNSDVATFNTAEMRCNAASGHLASIHSAQEQSFISGMIMNSVGSLNYWIGANDRDQTRGWQWTDGSPFYYWNWNSGEPNGASTGEYCVELSAELNQARWNDISCDRLFGYICKKKSTAATPHPSEQPTRPPVTCDNQQPVVSGTHYIRDLGIEASSSTEGRLPKYARLNNAATSTLPGSWTADKGEESPWIGVAFTHYMTIGGIQTRGAGDRQEWVTSYEIAYRLQYASFYQTLVNSDGSAMIFDGNTDSNSMVERKFGQLILVHAIRIQIRKFQNAASMRFELLGCKYETCSAQPLVSGESMVPDRRLTASGSWDDMHAPHRGRINSIQEGEYRGGWIANYPWTSEQWIQAEFDTEMAIYAVQTKGREDYPQWASSYKLLYTDNLGSWEVYQEPYGTVKIFSGNNDQNSLVTNYLAANIYGVKYIRLNPQSWSENGMGLRFEILGCNAKLDGCTDIPLLSGETSFIANSRLTASSAYDGTSGPSRSRLNSRAMAGLAGAWVPAQNNIDQWIQADLGKRNLILAMATQGRDELVMYLTAYSLSYSVDGMNFATHSDGKDAIKVFEANWDSHHVHKYYLTPTIEARYVRLHPVQWNVSIAVRWEIYACAGWASPSYIGCYKDESDSRDLNGKIAWYPPDGMSVDKCAKYCLTEGFLYAGVQFGYECFCGNQYGRYGTSEDCVDRCSGDRNQVCGGANVNSVYHTGVYSPDQVIGCFSDNGDRDLPYEHIMNVPGGITQSFCAMHCFNKGYRYAGIQVASECFCGNSYGRYGPSSNCVQRCPGDPSQSTFCGGDWSNTIISTGLAPDHLGCRAGFTSYGNSCYQFLTQRMTWTGARSACMALAPGCDLATVNYASEQDYINTRIPEYRMEFWNGLHCRRHNNFFEWTSGAPVLYTNWARREPNSASSDENCVMMHQSGTWNDDPCSDEGRKNGAVCEMDKEEMVEDVTPTPDPSCPMHWQGFRWKCYTLVIAPWSWQMAKQQCEGLEANLVRIEDSYEQAFLTSTFVSRRESFWTDLREVDSEFSFSNGDRPPFTSWAANQPADNGGNACVHIDMNEHGLWKSASCDMKASLICETNRKDQTRPSVAPTNPGPGICAPGWTPIGSTHCFNVFAPTANFRLTRAQALLACREMGADLVSIHSHDDKNQILTYTASKTGDFWIGLSATESGGYQWSDGTPVDFENWEKESAFGEAGSHIADDEAIGVKELSDAECVAMHQQTGTWQRIQCESLRNWICKIRQGLTPSMTTTAVPPSPGPPGSCAPDNDNWKFFNGQCYLVSAQHSAVTDWWEAEHQCRQYGGHLTSIHTSDEQRFIEGQILQVLEHFGVWIGLNDVNSVGTWQWTDESPTDYVHWGQGSPTGERSLCVALDGRVGGFGRWNDVHCQSAYPYVCSKVRGGSTILTPSPTPMVGYCPTGYAAFYDKCFRFMEEPATWSEAHSRCQQAGGKPYGLASIADKLEQAFILSHLATRSSSAYWIGLHQFSAVIGEFGWIDNTRVTYTNWGQYRPSGMAGRDCVYMYNEPYRAGQWTDGSCSSTLPYVCSRLRDSSITTPPPEPANTCPANYVLWQGNCYRSLSEKRSWQNSENECVKDQGRLTSVADRYEQGFIASQFASVATQLWIGLTDKEVPGRYTWSDNSFVTYTSWSSGAPASTSGGCVYLARSKFNDWMDTQCDAAYSAVCKITRVNTSVTRPPGGGCPSDSFGHNWMEFGNHCYLFRPEERVHYQNASLSCMLSGGYLASIHSDDENRFIFNGLAPNSEQMQWIGMTRNPGGGFIWLDGSDQTYFNWNDGEPSDVNEQCVEMYMHNGGWNDVGCDARNGYVCKKRQLAEYTSTLMTPRPSPFDSTTQRTVTPTASPATTPFVVPTTRRTTYAIVTPGEGDYDEDGSKAMSSSDIAGITFGCILLALLVAVTVFIYFTRRRNTINISFINPSFAQTTPAMSIDSSSA